MIILKSSVARRFTSAVVGAVVVAGLVAVAGPAQASVSCTEYVRNSAHTATVKCTNSSPSTGTYRVKAVFCNSGGGDCVTLYGPYRSYDAAGSSSVTDNARLTNYLRVEAEQGPPGGL